MVGGGFWGPNPSDMRLIRGHIAQDPEDMRDVLNDPDFIHHFGTMQGNQVKTAPRGYTTDHPAIDLLRYKQFFASRSFKDREVLASDFAEKALETQKH